MSQAEPEINYLAKDYASFRRLMLDRLALLLPDGIEDQPADLQIALVELLAYVADHLSYYQDAVATEAYLGTARRRASIRRHARLLSYTMHEGRNARAWIRCRVDKAVTVNSNWRFLTKGIKPLVFEPCHNPTLYPQHNRIAVYAADADGSVLNAGAAKARLIQSDPKLNLKPGDLLLLEALDHDTDVALRHVVRLEMAQDHSDGTVEITWNVEDALPFDLPVRRTNENGETVVCGYAFGNIVLSDHGRKHTQSIDTHDPGSAGYCMPFHAGPLTRAEPIPVDFVNPVCHGVSTSAAALMTRKAVEALPAIVLNGAGEMWRPSSDLLECSGMDASFVLETESDGSTMLRFGDGVHGRFPSNSTKFDATYRIGNGRAGNVGVDMITRVEGDESDGVEITNPLRAQGGIDPESPEQVRLHAPQAFRKQMRAISTDDYATLAGTYPGVERAAAEIRWTGSWYTVFLYVDRSGGLRVDDAFKNRLIRYMDQYRLAGYDIEIREPAYIPLEIRVLIDVKPGFVPNAVSASFYEAFGNGSSGGRRGFFNADNWTLGQSVYLSRVYSTALAVPGVEGIDIPMFGRSDGPGRPNARDKGVVLIGPHEIVSHQHLLECAVTEEGRIEVSIKGAQE